MQSKRQTKSTKGDGSTPPSEHNPSGLDAQRVDIPEPLAIDSAFTVPKNWHKQKQRKFLIKRVRASISRANFDLHGQRLPWDKQPQRMGYLIHEIIDKAIESSLDEIVDRVEKYAAEMINQIDRGKIEKRLVPEMLLKHWFNLERYIKAQELKGLAKQQDEKYNGGLFK